MFPFRRILIPTDFSTAAEWIFDDAVRIAGASAAEIVILHVRITRGSHPDELRFPADPSIYEYAERQELETLQEKIRKANASIPTRLVVRQAPDPGAEICRVAGEEKADLVVIATHARHHVAHLFIGSTTMQLLVDPPAPVLAIRYGIKKRTAIRRVVIPIHPQQTTHPAQDLGVAIATRLRAELHLITICEAKDQQVADDHLRASSAALAPLEVRTATIRGSDVEKEICKYAERVDADLLLLNANGDPGPVKRDIIRHSAAPVMIVPGPKS